MELMAMASPMPDMAMVPTPMPTTERGLLMLSPRLMLTLTTMELTVLVMAMLVLAMLDMAMVLTPTPMVPTPTPTERGLLMPSLRLMPMLTTMELTVLAMLDMAMLLPTPMVPTPMPTDMASKKSTTPIRVAHQVQTQKLKSKQNIKFDIQCHYKSFVIVGIGQELRNKIPSRQKKKKKKKKKS